MKNYFVAVAALLLACAAVAGEKHHRLGVTIGPGATGQPGQLPSQVFAPGIPGPQAYFVYDGGPSAIPAVQDVPLFAPAIFIGGSAGIGGYGVVESISGWDGGPAPGVLFSEVGIIVTAGGTVQTNTNRNFSAADGGVGLAAAICQCGAIVAAGASSGSITGCYMTTDGGISQVNLTSDGGEFSYSCIGY